MDEHLRHDRTVRLLAARLDGLAVASLRVPGGERMYRHHILAAVAATRHAIDLDLLSPARRIRSGRMSPSGIRTPAGAAPAPASRRRPTRLGERILEARRRSRGAAGRRFAASPRARPRARRAGTRFVPRCVRAEPARCGSSRPRAGFSGKPRTSSPGFDPRPTAGRYS